MIYIYVKTKCPYSVSALRMLRDYKIPFEAIVMDNAVEWNEMKKELSEITKQEIRTVPQVFEQDDKTTRLYYIGDSEDLVNWIYSTKN